MSHHTIPQTKIEPQDDLWLACLQYAQRHTSDELHALRMAVDYYRTNVGVASRISPACVRSMQRQADGLRSILRRGEPELEIDE
jgi:hypothetical protein